MWKSLANNAIFVTGAYLIFMYIYLGVKTMRSAKRCIYIVIFHIPSLLSNLVANV